jgi:Zn-dependent protease with chaperone function
LDINTLRHPKEKNYGLFMMAFGILGWLGFILSTFGGVLVMALFAAGALWLVGQFFKAAMLGNAALVSERQYPELHRMVLDGCTQLGIAEPPKVFVMNGGGVMNAFATVIGGGKYVLLYANLVDMMVDQKMGRELKMIICHELGHHVAGHVSPLKNLLLMPARMIPYLGMAYGRSCEFTADRIGAMCAGDLISAKRALVAITVGSRALKTDLDAFAEQEKQISPLFGHMSEIYATHPRMTRRVLELDSVQHLMPKRRPARLAAERSVPAIAAGEAGMPAEVVSPYENTPVER